VIRRLIEEGAQVHASDPEAMEKAKSVLQGVTFHATRMKLCAMRMRR